MPRLPEGVAPLRAAAALLLAAAIVAGGRAAAGEGGAPAAGTAAPGALPADGEADAEAVKSMDPAERERRLRLAVDRVSRDFSGVRTLGARFEQRKRLEVLEEEAVSRGTLAIGMPSRLRWEYTEPVRTLLVVNGARARRERTSRKGVVTGTTFDLKDDPVASATTGQVFLWVGGRTAEASKSHSLEILSEKPLRIRAVPKDERVAKVIVSVELEFAGDPSYLSRIVLRETSKTRTEIGFRDLERNPDLAADLFVVGEEKGR